MILTELALQGIKGFPPVARIALQAGGNVAQSADPERRAALLDAIYHTLYPDPSRNTATEHLKDPSAPESRIALTFYGRDKLTYRIIREAVNGAVKLYRYEAESQKFTLFTSTSTEAAQYVRVQQQLPDEVGFERLFIFSPEAMPSKGERATTRSGTGLMSGFDAAAPSGPGLPANRFMSGVMPRGHSGMGAGPGMGGGFGSSLNMTNALVQSEIEAEESGEAAPEEKPQSLEDKKVTLQRLWGELDTLVRGERAQQEIDQLNHRKFELAERVQQISQLREGIESFDRELANESDLNELPPNFAERLRNFEMREERFAVEQDRIQVEIDRTLDEIDAFELQPLKKDPYFLAGTSIAALFLLLAIGFQKSLLAFLNLPAALVAVGAAFRWVSERETLARMDYRKKAAEKQLERLEKQHDLDTGVTRKLMAKLDIDSPGTLMERFERFEELHAERTGIQQQLDQLLADNTTRRAEEELQQITRRLESLEADVMSASGATMSKSALERKVQALEAELGPDVPPRIKKMPPTATGPLQASSMPSGGPVAVPEPSESFSMDLAAQSEFSSHTAPMSPISTHDLPAPPSTEDLMNVKKSFAKTSVQVEGAPAASPSGTGQPGVFDYGGGMLLDDDDDDPGYGSGYGGSGGGSGGMSTKSGSEDGYFAIGGGGFGMPPGMGGGLPGSYGEGGPAPDRSRDLMQSAVDLLSMEVDELAKKLEPRLVLYLKALTAGRFDQVSFGVRGEVSVSSSEAREPVPYPEIDPDVVDFVDLSLRFSLAEVLVRKFQIPMLIDDPIVHLDEARRPLFLQMLGYFSSATQVIVATQNSDIPGQPIQW